MIEMVMLVTLGFLLGCLLALLLARPFWRRAVRLTNARLDATMPMTAAEIRADKDQLRAQFAVHVQRLESMASRAQEKAVRQLVEANKRRAAINMLEREVAQLKRRAGEMENANAVLLETVERRLPDLEARLTDAHKETAAREAEVDAYKIDYAAQTSALSAAREDVKRRVEEIERLRLALETAPGSTDADDPRRLQAELSRVREELHRRKQIEAQENADLLERIQQLADQIMDGTPRPHIAEVKPLPKPVVKEPEPPQPVSKVEVEEAPTPAKLSPLGRVRALRRAAGGKRSLSERLDTLPADAD